MTGRAIHSRATIDIAKVKKLLSQGLNGAEIAQRLGVSRASVNKALFRIGTSVSELKQCRSS